MNLFVFFILIIIIYYFSKKNIENFSNNPTISVCIPCIPRDINKLPRTLNSINNQTVQPLEVIIGLSETSNEYAKHLLKKLDVYNFPVKIENTIDKAYAGPNRNRAAKKSSGELISFMDADDIMHHKKLELITKIYNKFKPKCIVHNHASKLKNFKLNKKNKILRSKAILKAASRQKEKNNNWYDKYNNPHNWISLKPVGIITHGHPTIHRSVLDKIKYGNQRTSEDAIFIRNLIKNFDIDENTIIWLNQPLSYYIPSKLQKYY